MTPAGTFAIDADGRLSDVAIPGAWFEFPLSVRYRRAHGLHWTPSPRFSWLPEAWEPPTKPEILYWQVSPGLHQSERTFMRLWSADMDSPSDVRNPNFVGRWEVARFTHALERSSAPARASGEHEVKVSRVLLEDGTIDEETSAGKWWSGDDVLWIAWHEGPLNGWRETWLIPHSSAPGVTGVGVFELGQGQIPAIVSLIARQAGN